VFRTLGVAAKLRRAAKDAIDAGRAEFLYAHPNSKMQLIHDKVGHFPVGTMVRYAKPLSAGDYLRRQMGGGWLPAVAGKVAGKVADAALRLTGYERRHKPAFATSVVEAPSFDQRFDRLFADAARVRRVLGVRDAKYLRWRYAENPLYRTHAVLAEEGGRLAGYLLFGDDQKWITVRDVFAADAGPVVDDLLARLIGHARSLHRGTISTIFLEGHAVEPALVRFGFSRRQDGSQMYGYAPPSSSLASVVLDRGSWLLSVGDRDV
jgi:hypothetical protein